VPLLYALSATMSGGFSFGDEAGRRSSISPQIAVNRREIPDSGLGAGA
jgi:hypothetical protein